MMGDYRILLGGDIFPSKKNMSLFTSGLGEELFDKRIIDLFNIADFKICNLEGVFTDSTISIDKVDPVIKAPKDAIKGFDILKLSCVTLANNHIIDFGQKGFEDTIRVLEDNSILYFGAGKTGSIENYILINANGRIVIVYNVAETMFNIPTADRAGANIYDEYTVCNELKELKDKCDYLIVIYHGGMEFFWYGSELLRQRFHRMADSGADIITAQHTHCIGLQEVYNGTFIFYGQGDFLFARKENEYRKYGLLLEIIISHKHIDIKKHLIKHIDNHVVYDQEQDFTEFDNRDYKYSNGDNYISEFKEYSDEKLVLFLEAFRGKSFIDRIARKIMNPENYKRYIKNRYSNEHILRIISSIQFDEYNELVNQGLWDMIYERKKND